MRGVAFRDSMYNIQKTCEDKPRAGGHIQTQTLAVKFTLSRTGDGGGGQILPINYYIPEELTLAYLEGLKKQPLL